MTECSHIGPVSGSTTAGVNDQGQTGWTTNCIVSGVTKQNIHISSPRTDFTMCVQLQMSRLQPVQDTSHSKTACRLQNPIRQQPYQVCSLSSWHLVCFGFLGSLGLLGHGGQISLHLGQSILVSIGQLLYQAHTVNLTSCVSSLAPSPFEQRKGFWHDCCRKNSMA